MLATPPPPPMLRPVIMENYPRTISPSLRKSSRRSVTPFQLRRPTIIPSKRCLTPIGSNQVTEERPMRPSYQEIIRNASVRHH